MNWEMFLIWVSLAKPQKLMTENESTFWSNLSKQPIRAEMGVLHTGMVHSQLGF